MFIPAKSFEGDAIMFWLTLNSFQIPKVIETNDRNISIIIDNKSDSRS